MNTRVVHYQFLIILAAGTLGIFFVLKEWQTTNVAIGTVAASLAESDASVKIVRKKPPQQIVKGIYLTAVSAGSSDRLEKFIELINKTELNAVVIDIKDYTGFVLYDSQVPLVKSLKLKKNLLGDVRALTDKLHESNIYTIARQTVFQDPALATAKPEWAIKNKNGEIWADHKGLSWIDPTKRPVWEYNLAIAKEAAMLGFDEVNFDYIRFPSDGDMSAVVYSTTSKKYQVMRNFYSFVSDKMADEPAWTSFDMFGFVMEKTGANDMNIGQRLADAIDKADYISPMMYPSHYPSGHLGLKNPAAEPGLVIENGLRLGSPLFKNQRSQLRPWIQAFNLGAVYDGEKIREQIDVVEKYTDAGWLMWNAANRYSTSGLRTE